MQMSLRSCIEPMVWKIIISHLAYDIQIVLWVYPTIYSASLEYLLFFQASYIWWETPRYRRVFKTVIDTLAGEECVKSYMVDFLATQSQWPFLTCQMYQKVVQKQSIGSTVKLVILVEVFQRTNTSQSCQCSTFNNSAEGMRRSAHPSCL